MSIDFPVYPKFLKGRVKNPKSLIILCDGGSSLFVFQPAELTPKFGGRCKQHRINARNDKSDNRILCYAENAFGDDFVLVYVPYGSYTLHVKYKFVKGICAAVNLGKLVGRAFHSVVQPVRKNQFRGFVKRKHYKQRADNPQQNPPQGFCVFKMYNLVKYPESDEVNSPTVVKASAPP